MLSLEGPSSGIHDPGLSPEDSFRWSSSRSGRIHPKDRPTRRFALALPGSAGVVEPVRVRVLPVGSRRVEPEGLHSGLV